MQIDPITKSKPTIADVAKGFNQIHACLEDHKERMTVELAAAAKEALAARTDVASIREALGLTDPKKKVAALASPFQAFTRNAVSSTTGLVACIFIYRMAVAVWPGFWGFLLALNHAVLTGKF